MKKIKLIFRIIWGLAVGIGFGYLVGLLVGVLISGESLSVIPQKLGDLSLGDGFVGFLISMAALLLVLPVQIILHEAGHLVFGLLSGYKFVSFRVGAVTLIRRNGKYCVKKYRVIGTGGQCLLTPPDLPLEKMPFFWYNAGGVIVNLLLGTIALAIMLAVDDILSFGACSCSLI